VSYPPLDTFQSKENPGDGRLLRGIAYRALRTRDGLCHTCIQLLQEKVFFRELERQPKIVRVERPYGSEAKMTQKQKPTSHTSCHRKQTQHSHGSSRGTSLPHSFFGTSLAKVSQSLSARRQHKRGTKNRRASSEGLKLHGHSADTRHNDTLSQEVSYASWTHNLSHDPPDTCSTPDALSVAAGHHHPCGTSPPGRVPPACG
jgi:hypothetical protein